MADKAKMPVEGSRIMMLPSRLNDNPIYSDAEYAAKARPLASYTAGFVARLRSSIRISSPKIR